LGAWNYTLIAEHEGSSYEYDSGTITFEGTETGGTFTQFNTMGKSLADFKSVIPLAWMVGGARILPRVVEE
jgi:hypothetical protein